jgi:hypothetical protein
LNPAGIVPLDYGNLTQQNFVPVDFNLIMDPDEGSVARTARLRPSPEHCNDQNKNQSSVKTVWHFRF